MKIPHLALLPSLYAKECPEKTVLFQRNKETNSWDPISWATFNNWVEIIATALYDLGISNDKKIAIYSQNKVESFVVDFANFQLKAISVPLYATSSKEQVAYIINDAKVEILFVGDQKQYDNAVAIMNECPSLRKIVAFSEEISIQKEHSIYYKTLFEQGASSKTDFRKEMGNPEYLLNDLATIMYTSGTTGEPKGVMLIHENYNEAIRIHNIKLVSMSEEDTSITFLPISHVFERAWCYVCMFKKASVYVNEFPLEIQERIQEVRPTLMCAVPRFWEKVFVAVKEAIDNYSPIMRGIVAWAISIGEKYNIKHLSKGKKANPFLALEYYIADKLVFSKVKKKVGIENGNFFPVAGSSLSNEILYFFRCIGIPLMYGYGLTETTATVSCFDYVGYQIGSVGNTMSDLQVKISDDDEILVKGKTITPGYYNRPEANKESFTEDGFFRTGDAGKLVGNHLYLTERIKDLFKTSNGKYIAPQQIENRLSAITAIEQVITIGDKRNFVTALIVPNREVLQSWAMENNLQFKDDEEMLNSQRIKDFVMNQIQEAQKGMATYEHIKKFEFIKKGFTMEGGELTNTLKFRRAFIINKYDDLIEKMYKN
jgi:long-chain acyl-CoA synthetase